MLSNAYFLAKIRFDTAENEPAEILQNLKTKKIIILLTLAAQARERGRVVRARNGIGLAKLGKLAFFFEIL